MTNFIPNFIIPDALLLLFPFIVIGIRLFVTTQSKVPWRLANFGFIAIFFLLNFIPLASGNGRFFICNWKVDDFGVLTKTRGSVNLWNQYSFGSNFFKPETIKNAEKNPSRSKTEDNSVLF